MITTLLLIIHHRSLIPRVDALPLKLTVQPVTTRPHQSDQNDGHPKTKFEYIANKISYL